MIFVLILAGGTGSRMGAENPKQFLEIEGKSIVGYTVETFTDNSRIDGIIVLVPDEWIGYTRNIIARDVQGAGMIDVIGGGMLRNDTIICGIDHIEKKYGLDENTMLLTHDAARPFVTRGIIDANIDVLNTYSSCGTVIPATDTMIYSRDGISVDAVPDRTKLYRAQTPQSFHALKFRDIYKTLSAAEKAELTDATGVFVMKGEKVGLVRGALQNIKITYPEDLNTAESILSSRR